jgi:hypothetical protein
MQPHQHATFLDAVAPDSDPRARSHKEPEFRLSLGMTTAKSLVQGYQPDSTVLHAGWPATIPHTALGYCFGVTVPEVGEPENRR